VASNLQAANIGASQLAHSTPYIATVIGLAVAARQRLGRRRHRRPVTPASTGPTAETVSSGTLASD
jgi:hypothetical protein